MSDRIIKPPSLRMGDTIGLISPCLGVSPDAVEVSVKNIQAYGFKVKAAKNMYSFSDGYAGTIAERAEDFNAMISDDEVKLILFGGGEVCNEILPYIDYENIKRHPKILCSYSDSTTILNAVNSLTGLVTFYGASIRTFGEMNMYNIDSAKKRVMDGSLDYIKSSPWKIIYHGECEGVLAGGYLANFAAMQGLEYYPEVPEGCLLFIEDHIGFSTPAMVSKWFSNLEHRGVFKAAKGLIFGHYSTKEEPLIDNILFRLGSKYKIPVVRCEDFGHGVNNAVLPIGVTARLSTFEESFRFKESAVQKQNEKEQV